MNKSIKKQHPYHKFSKYLYIKKYKAFNQKPHAHIHTHAHTSVSLKRNRKTNRITIANESRELRPMSNIAEKKSNKRKTHVCALTSELVGLSENSLYTT